MSDIVAAPFRVTTGAVVSGVVVEVELPPLPLLVCDVVVAVLVVLEATTLTRREALPVFPAASVAEYVSV